MTQLASRFFSAIAALLLATSANAQISLGERLVSSLSYCDARFFDEVSASRGELDRHAQVIARGRAATFPVPDMTHDTESKSFFALPVEVRGLIVIGYFDEIKRIPGGVIVSWGLLVPTSTTEAAQKLGGLFWEGERLRMEGEVFVRSEVWHHDEPMRGWVKEVTEPGLPKPKTVERVLMVEPYSGETAFIRVGCSLQGAVTREMLDTLRPDLPLKAQ